MIKLKIDNREVEVEKGATVLEAANKLGIEIPTMCYLKGYTNSPSCMICLVKDKKRGKLQASCALPAADNMDIISLDDEIREARKEALELLLSDHVGDCEAPCRTACPAYMDIPKMNRLIATGNFAEAHKIVKQEIAIPHILGYICPAPCEKVCRRNQADEFVSICQLKKFVAAEDEQNSESYFPEKQKSSGKKVAIIGSGPAGLTAAYHLLQSGHQAIIFDKNEKAGGSLRTQEMYKHLPVEVLDAELSLIEKFGADIILNETIDSSKFEDLKKDFEAVIIAIGQFSESDATIFQLKTTKTGIEVNTESMQTSDPKVFVCGSAIKTLKMAVRSVAQGKASAYAVSQFLSGKTPEKEHRMFNSKFGKLSKEEAEEYLKEATDDARVLPKKGDLKGFSKEEAMKEAARCMHCDCRKVDNCKLRIFSDEYEADRKKYLFGDRKQLEKKVQHDQIIYEPEKCIRCGLCVDITNKKKELTGLSFVGRGFDVRIKIPFDKTISDALKETALEVANACPTGALAVKD